MTETEIQRTLLYDEEKNAEITVKFVDDRNGEPAFLVSSQQSCIVRHSSGRPTRSWQETVAQFKEWIREKGVYGGFKIKIEGENKLKDMTKEEQKEFLKTKG